MTNVAEKYDTAFLGILQNEGNIKGFLHAVFGFLYRRTDFYRYLSKDGKLGFPPKVAEQMTYGAFKEFELKAREDDKRAEETVRKKEAAAAKKKEAVDTVPLAGTTDNKSESNVTSSATPEEASKLQTPEGATGQQSLAVESSRPPKECSDVDEDELTRQQKVFQSNPDSYNGAIRDKYSWSQSISDVDIKVQIPKYLKKGKDVKVEIKRKHLKVNYNNDTGQWVNWLDDNLTWEVNPEESMWSLVPGESIQINLEKVQERWWEGVLESEPKISVQKIHPERPITDLDEESQAKIQQLMYDDHQKKLGKPTSEQQKMHDMLKQAWDAEGSPFKGQPFDPSKLNIGQNNDVNIQ